MLVDLHLHTQESDGSLSVLELLKLAYKNNVRVLSITDHESTNGVTEAVRICQDYGIKVIPGVELLTSYKGHEVHLLGYFGTIQNEILQKRLKELRELRTALAYDMVKCLQKDGLSLKWSEVELEANSEAAVSKGHIMKALYNNSKLERNSWPKVASLFQPGGVAYLPFLEHPFEEAVEFIYATGGIPVLAHPGLIREDEIVEELLSYRPIGLEVYYGYWENRESMTSHYEKLAKTKALLGTGGSDYHGPYSQVQIGQVSVPLEQLNQLEEFLKG